MANARLIGTNINDKTYTYSLKYGKDLTAGAILSNVVEPGVYNLSPITSFLDIPIDQLYNSSVKGKLIVDNVFGERIQRLLCSDGSEYLRKGLVTVPGNVDTITTNWQWKCVDKPQSSTALNIYVAKNNEGGSDLGKGISTSPLRTVSGSKGVLKRISRNLYGGTLVINIMSRDGTYIEKVQPTDTEDIVIDGFYNGTVKLVRYFDPTEQTWITSPPEVRDTWSITTATASQNATYAAHGLRIFGGIYVLNCDAKVLIEDMTVKPYTQSYKPFILTVENSRNVEISRCIFDGKASTTTNPADPVQINPIYGAVRFINSNVRMHKCIIRNVTGPGLVANNQAQATLSSCYLHTMSQAVNSNTSIVYLTDLTKGSDISVGNSTTYSGRIFEGAQ